MALDSPAAFTARVAALDLAAHTARFDAAGWKTMANIAFSSPQGGTEEAFFENILLLGLGAADHKDANLLRRLYFESYMLAAADLKRRADPTPGTGREMSNPERKERFDRVEKRLGCIRMRDELEPSHRLVDRCVDMVDANSVKHLSVELCTKRNLEIRGIEKDPEWATVPDPVTGAPRSKRVKEDHFSPVDSQFAFGFALQRRALALEMADILSFENHELLKARFTAALMKEPLSGFQRLSVEQIVEADIVFWQTMAELTRDGIRRQGSADRPCDAAMQAALKHEDFTMAMTPRLMGVPTGAVPSLQNGPAAPNFSGGTLSKRAVKKQNLKQKALSAPPPQLRIGNNSSGGKGASKGDKGRKGAPMIKLPPGLHGMCSKSDTETHGERLCFAFSLGQCNACQPGQDCAKGAHLCMKAGPNGEACSQPHGALQCKRS